MQILDSLTGKKIELNNKKEKINLFVCGITPYDYPHIGNIRTYLSFDIAVRYLRSRGLKVFYLQNITDIDDKIIKISKEEKTSWKSVARKFEKIYHQNEKELNIVSVNKYARATDYIPQITSQVKSLLEKGYAYKIEGDGYYFDISRFSGYGKLSGRTTGQAEDGISRIDESINKRNKGDFCLWKFSKKEEPSWNTDLGKGRPGWHIEDTAITEHFFGPQYDIHGGAVDLKFPHHEAEIAQQEAASGKEPLVKIWMHTGFLLVDGKKMSKSLNNFISAKDFLKNHSGEILRYIVLSHHYRSPIDYSDKLVFQASSSLDSIKSFLGKLNLIKNKGDISGQSKKMLEEAAKKFKEAMDDDFNAPKALAEIFSLINSIEKNIWTASKKEAGQISDLITGNLRVLGLDMKLSHTPLKVRLLAKKREVFRRNKQFIQSDALRARINQLGYEVEDTPLGPLITKR